MVFNGVLKGFDRTSIPLMPETDSPHTPKRTTAATAQTVLDQSPQPYSLTLLPQNPEP